MGMRNVKKQLIAYAKKRANDWNYRADKYASNIIKSHHCPPLTSQEKREIDDYWAQFGVKFRNYDFHQMFYGITGIKDPRFIPELFADLVLYPYYNDMSRIVGYQDKNMFTTFVPGMRFPKAICSRMNGYYHDASGHYCGDTLTDEQIAAMYQNIVAENNHSIILKKTSMTCAGRGVKKYEIHSEQELRTVIAEQGPDDFVIQFAIHQHPFFAQLNPDSVNIIRINTWRNGDQVHVFAPCIRYGLPGSFQILCSKTAKRSCSASASMKMGR